VTCAFEWSGAKVNGQVGPNEWPALTIPNSQLFNFKAEETQTFYKTLSGNEPVMLLRIADELRPDGRARQRGKRRAIRE
jgi:hypothetical protein